MDKELSRKIQEALAKKPTADYLMKRGFAHPNIISRRRRTSYPEKKMARVVKTKPQDIPLFEPPKSYIVSTTEWQKTNKPIDVSIIVPLYRSTDVISRQIQSWYYPKNITTEIIYVDDDCPTNSKKSVLKAWEQQSYFPVGKIIANKKNAGFAHTCNTGAKFASGKYLIFLNADCTVTPGWIEPLVQTIEKDPEIGIVGNLQLKYDGKIDSAGSEWNWFIRRFSHIGRNTHNGSSLSEAYKLSNTPKDLLTPGEREMVTGCCFLIPRNLFLDLDGFDTKFLIGYWEDSDLNLRVRSAGYKVFYQPNSMIFHQSGHTGLVNHKFYKHNMRFFESRWINTGRLDQLVRDERQTGKVEKTLKDNVNGPVIGCVIACNEEEFLQVSVDSIAHLVDRWIFVIGGNKYAYLSGMCKKKGYPTDNTLEIARELAKKYDGHVITPPGRTWYDKVEMRNAYARELQEDDWMFVLDGDEVYKDEQLWYITSLMKQYEAIILNFWVFWNNVNTVGTGTWDKYTQERIIRWKDGYRYSGQNHFHVQDSQDKIINQIRPCYRENKRLFYHYSWIRPIEKIRQKLEYYKNQSGRLFPRDYDYVDDVFLKWRKDPEAVEGKTHPMGGGGTMMFPGIHPRNIQKLIDQGKLNF